MKIICTNMYKYFIVYSLNILIQECSHKKKTVKKTLFPSMLWNNTNNSRPFRIGSSSTRGFNATYRVNSCVGECYGNRECVEDRCACKPGFGGIDCNLELCPHNCSSAIGQGTCNLVGLGNTYIGSMLASIHVMYRASLP